MGEDDKTQAHVALTKGTMVGHYRIIEKIGAGGMGEVYLAQDTKLNRKVALKFLPPHLCQDEDCRKRFTREAQAAAGLDHPNIAGIHEVGEYAGRPFYSMQVVEGQSLREIVKGEDLSVERILEIAVQICEGLQAAHSKGIIHRDIKPSNILIDVHGRVRIVDFGLAAIRGSKHLTKTGSTLGTIGYMSPEQIEGKETDARSDLFSLGVVLYELVASKAPFRRADETATLKAILQDTPEPLARYKSDVPDDLQRIISKLLEKDSSLRYQSAAGVIPDLKRLLPGLVSTAAVPKRTDWWNRYVVPVAVVVLLGIAGYWWFGARDQTPVTSTGDRIMLAVLPFENLGNPEDEYFADGITEEIIARLAGIKQLGVIARTSIIQYKGTEKTIQEIGSELGVDYILEGTIRWQKSDESPDRVRITPQLIKVSDATHLWADVFDEVLTEVFQVQSDVANLVATKLDIALLEPERAVLGKEPTKNVEAFDFYLRGNTFFNVSFVDGQSMKHAAQFFTRAIEIDSGFAEAWAKLCRAHIELYWHQKRDEGDLAAAEAAVSRALSLNPDLPEAHVAMGSLYYHAGQYDRALEEFDVARKQAPNSSDLLAEIAYCYRRQGKMEQAAAELIRAVELDPRSGIKLQILGDTYLRMQQYALAEECFDLALDIIPDVDVLHVTRAWLHVMRDGDIETAREIMHDAYEYARITPFSSHWSAMLDLAAGDYDGALEKYAVDDPGSPGESHYSRAHIYGLQGKPDLARLHYDSARVILEEGVLRSPEDPRNHAGLAITYAGLNRRDEAMREAARTVELAPLAADVIYNQSPITSAVIAYVRIGEVDSAISLLEDLVSQPCIITPASISVMPYWAPLRDHPSFKALLEKHGDNDGT